MLSTSRKRKDQAKRSIKRNEEFIKNIPIEIRFVFSTADLANIIYQYLNFSEKIRLASVSQKFKIWIYRRLSDNKKCDDLEEAIICSKYELFIEKSSIKPTIMMYNKKTKTKKILFQIYTNDYQNITWQYVLDREQKFNNNPRLCKMLIENNCYIFLHRLFFTLKSWFVTGCDLYKKMYECSKHTDDPAHTINFVHNILKLGPCQNTKCAICTPVMHSIIESNIVIPFRATTTESVTCENLVRDDLYELLTKSAIEGSYKSFVSIYAQIENIITHKQLNTLLMIACKSCHFDGTDPIIKFCIDHEANPYIIVNESSSYCLVDEEYLTSCNPRIKKLRNYIIDNSRKYSHDLVFENCLMRCLNSTPSDKYCTLNLLFYFDKITMSDNFIKRFLIINFSTSSKFYPEYFKLKSKILEDMTMSDYLNHCKDLPMFERNFEQPKEDHTNIDLEIINDFC